MAKELLEKYSVGLNESLKKAVNALMDKYGISASSAIRMLMTEGLESLKEQGRV